jgi:putative PIN family toxin of toxin-antitoxin system
MGATMARPRVVLDTNVVYAGLRSRRGASFQLLKLLAQGAFESAVSVPLVLEYEHSASRLTAETSLSTNDISTALDFLVSVAHLQEVHFSWRPALPDPDDDFVLELAVAAACSHIVTFNLRDFRGSEQFGITPITPNAFLSLLRNSS